MLNLIEERERVTSATLHSFNTKSEKRGKIFIHEQSFFAASKICLLDSTREKTSLFVKLEKNGVTLRIPRFLDLPHNLSIYSKSFC